MIPFRYYLDIILSPIFAGVLTFLYGLSLLPFVVGALAWTFVEYASHRWFLHSRAGKEMHIAHHAHPDETISDTAWQVYVGIVVAGVLAGSSFAVGVLVAYTWYLYVHHCSHHFPRGIPSSLLEHHEGHHKFARRNYGVSHVAWDVLFRTRLDIRK